MDSMGLTRYMSVLMDDAMKQARFFDHEFVMPEHMLLALLRQYAFCQALQEEGVDSLKMHEDLVEWLAKQERVPETIKYLPEPSSLFKTMFGTACALAAAADRQLVNVPHFVQAMFGLQNSEAAFLLCKNVGDRQGEFLASVDSYYPIGDDTGEAGMGMGADFDDDDYANEYDDDEEEGRRQVVQDWHQLVTCISDKVEEHNPLIGREQELDRTIQVLCRAEKNNPLHIGEAGVGKTALVYGLAKLINENQVPERLKGARIYGMDMGQMLAGAQYRGDFEKRIKMVMEGAVKEGNTIIYIDEIHNMIGAGRGSDGGPDASNMLKQYLEAGDIRFIGSTTYEEYNRYMAQSKGIVRRFQQIDIKEPTEEEAIKILEGLQYKYNKFHNVTYRKDALEYAVRASAKYISNRCLPDKAIDLMDEAAAKLRMERDSVPEELDEITRHLKQLEIEREAIKRENDQPKIQQLDKEIAELKDKEHDFRAKWEGEKALVNKIQQDKQEMENLKFEAERMEREGNYERVAEIRYSKLVALEDDIKKIQEQLKSTQGGEAMIREEVTADDIAEVVSRWTGIPVSRMMQSEREKLLHLEEELHKRVIGQDEAITAVSDAVRRSRAGLQDPKRPIASFIFLGTTGVGKTELAKALAEYLFNDESMMTRIDMSEYQEKFSVTRLIGAPPGYVGYDEGGQLTEAVRRKPYSVVLFDEIEKAHPDVFNTLLQVLDDGRLTDNKGRVVNFKNTIIIMTSNASREMLKKTFRPEFLNRIDDIITFKPLTQEQIAKVVELQMNRVKKMLEPQGFELCWTPAAISYLAEVGYDPEFGARPVKRAIQDYVLNDLSKKILSEEVSREKPITIDYTKEGGLVFENK